MLYIATFAVLALSLEAIPDDATLARQSSLEEVLAVALARHPSLTATRARAEGERARIPMEASLPEPALVSDLMGVPWSRPWDLGAADSIRLGLRQAIPPAAVRSARERAAAAMAARADEESRRATLDLVAAVRRSWATWVRSAAELEVHAAHATLLQRMSEAARAGYEGGRGSLADVLRARLESSRLHAHIVTLEERQSAALARLNTLMGREPGVRLGPPRGGVWLASADGDELELALEQGRPEVNAAERLVERRAAELEAARREGDQPELRVGLDYTWMPEGETRHHYSAMVELSLPWLWGRFRDQTRSAALELAADRAELELERLRGRGELAEARAHLAAARSRLRLIEQDLVPQARRAMEAEESAFDSGQASALEVLLAARDLLELRLEREEALEEAAMASADVARAAGLTLSGSEEETR